MSRLLSLVAFACLLGACDNRVGNPLVTAPTPVPPPVTGPPAAPNFQNPGPKLGSGQAIQAGQSLQGVVGPNDPRCFTNWDSGGHCKQFDFVAERDGRLRANLAWQEPAPGALTMSIFIVYPDGQWFWEFEGHGQAYVSAPISAGQKYAVIVMSVFPPQNFEVVANLQ